MSYLSMPALEAGGLRLEPLSERDADGIYALRSDADTVRFTGIAPYTRRKQAEDYIARCLDDMRAQTAMLWSIRKDGTFVGSICLWNFSADKRQAEIGYDLLPAYRGRGIMQQAVQAVLQCAFTSMGFHTVFADLRNDNAKSVSLLERNGFKRKRKYRGTQHGETVPMVRYECYAE